ncbi:MAG: hypothetical protein AAB758_01990 [Patescibacteria group bacterium]
MQKLNRFKIYDLGFRNGILLIILISFSLNLTSAPVALAHGGVNDDELIIRMTKNGFEPKEFTAVEGDEVLFINNDEANRWPASNFHPTHTLYPEFDPQGGIKPGESWKMKFEKVGTWRMHDHLFPHFTGTVVVLSDPNATTSQGRTLSTDSQGPTLNSPGFWAKIKNFFRNLFGGDKIAAAEFKSLSEKDKYIWLENVSAREGPKAAWNYVLKIYNTPKGVVGSPHDMAHLVGQLIFRKYGLDGLSICTVDFAFGCYHGLMEVAFANSLNENGYKENLLAAENGCTKIGDTNSPNYWSCIHGMGHGVATYRDHNLSLALKDCDTLSENISTYCHDGVFMENSISAPANFYKENDPVYPCNAVAEDYKNACARSQVQVMRLKFNMDIKSISKACLQTKNEKIIYHCIDALGYFIAQAANGQAERIVSDCQKIIDEKSAAQCAAAAAGELVFQNAVNWQRESDKICKSLSGDSRLACETRVSQVKKSYGR